MRPARSRITPPMLARPDPSKLSLYHPGRGGAQRTRTTRRGQAVPGSRPAAGDAGGSPEAPRQARPGTPCQESTNKDEQPNVYECVVFERVVPRIVYILFFKSLRLTSTLIVLYALAIGALYPTSDKLWRREKSNEPSLALKSISTATLYGFAVICFSTVAFLPSPPGAAEESMARPASPE